MRVRTVAQERRSRRWTHEPVCSAVRPSDIIDDEKRVHNIWTLVVTPRAARAQKEAWKEDRTTPSQ